MKGFVAQKGNRWLDRDRPVNPSERPLRTAAGLEHRAGHRARAILRGTDDFDQSEPSDPVMTELVISPRVLVPPATRGLVAAGYTSIDQLAGADAAILAALHGVGPRALRIIAATLAERGAAPLKEK